MASDPILHDGRAVATGDGGHASATGYGGHASATGYGAHASTTGDGGRAVATGDDGHAVATGDGGHAVAAGRHGIAAALGLDATAMAGPNGWVVLAAWRSTEKGSELLNVRAARVGGPEGIKPNVTYRLTDTGEFEKVNETKGRVD